MKPITKPSFILCLCAVAWIAGALPVSAQSTSTEFQQAVKAYQQSRSSADAEKVIKLALTLDPRPAIPEEARRHYVKACTLFDDAKQPSDSADAAEEFRQALLLAPWWGEAYMKRGLALETAQRYDDAIASLKLFMATKPPDDVLRKTQDEIYKIEAKQEKAAKDKELVAKRAAEEARAERETAAKKANPQEEFLKKIEGRRYRYSGPANSEAKAWIEVRDGTFIFEYEDRYSTRKVTDRVRIQGKETVMPPVKSPVGESFSVTTYILNEAGNEIMQRTRACHALLAKTDLSMSSTKASQ